MFTFPSVISRGAKALNVFRSPVANCDAETSAQPTEDDETPNLIRDANAAMEERKARIKTPMSIEEIQNSLQGGNVHTYDGFRIAVQKQLNLNTVVSHFYWLGSQAMGQPLYQYRLILAEEDKMLNVATDMDFNVEGEARYPLPLPFASRAGLKVNFTLAEQAKNMQAEASFSGDTYAATASVGRAQGTSIGCSFVQAITPALSLGGAMNVDLSKGMAVSNTYGVVYDKGEHVLTGVLDNNLRLSYLRKVNPNRVNVTASLTVDEKSNSTAGICAEYILKQSKVTLGVDSNLLFKTMLETTIAPGTQLQLCAEMMQAKDHYRFGYGITLGGN